MKKILTKHSMSMSQFIFSITIVDLLLYHLPFYKYVISHLDMHSSNGLLTFFSTFVSLFTVTTFLLFLIATILPSIMKFFAITMMMSNSIALYFVNTYNVILEKTMMGNVFNTNISEATSYYDPRIFLYIIVFGFLPSFFISRVEIKKTKRLHLGAYGLSTLIIGVIIMYLNSTTWLWLDKNAKVLGALSMPWSYSINAIRYKVKELKKNQKQILLPDAKIVNNNKMIVVLVIGESARAANFSLYGYQRETNPLLQQQNILVLKNSTSTATYTTASIHSMLSYTGSDSDSYEPLPNYLQRSGVDVMWRTNNWGGPNLHVQSFEEAGELKKSCTGDGCDYDEVLLTNLDKEILASKKNKIFVVLHTAGSHGPLYNIKYPEKFETFKPACKSVNLKECTHQELINAYDNTIVYTDYFLNKAINTLKKISDIPVLLLYASDHGESLGEYGLYLHGTPYSIAPDVQKHIPFILWESKSFMKVKGLKSPYVKNQDEYKQKNIFHTILGAFDIESTIYNNKQDLLRK